MNKIVLKLEDTKTVEVQEARKHRVAVGGWRGNKTTKQCVFHNNSFTFNKRGDERATFQYSPSINYAISFFRDNTSIQQFQTNH